MITFCNSYVLWLQRCVQLRLVTVTFCDATFCRSARWMGAGRKRKGNGTGDNYCCRPWSPFPLIRPLGGRRPPMSEGGRVGQKFQLTASRWGGGGGERWPGQTGRAYDAAYTPFWPSKKLLISCPLQSLSAVLEVLFCISRKRLCNYCWRRSAEQSFK